MHRFTRKAGIALAALGVAALAIATAAFARADVPQTATAASIACTAPTIGFMGPITGDAAFIGKEQLGFAKYAIRTLAGGKIKLVEGDTQLDAAQASTVGAQLPGRHEHARRRRPGRQPGSACRRADLQEGRADAVRLRLGDGDRADERQDPDVLPGRPERQRPGAHDRQLPPPEPEGEAGLHRRRPDGVLPAAGHRRAGEPEGRRASKSTASRSARR